MTTTLGIPREIRLRERRVAIVPEVAKALVGKGFAVALESGAGRAAGFEDAAYVAAGASIVARDGAWSADIVLKVAEPTLDEVPLLRMGATLVCHIFPARNAALVEALTAREATVVAMDKVPRSTIAQKCDALSSMAAIVGYRAVIEAAAAIAKPMSPKVTAAGKTPPTRVLIIGAGVAGLAAIGQAKAMGAVVRAFDTRKAAADEVKSLGGEFLELHFDEKGEGQGGYAKVMSPEFIAKEMELFAAQAPEVDIVITTALVPGAKAPLLWKAAHVAAMKPGSVVVDLAAHQGGNCELTKADEVVQAHGVTILGPTDLASRMAPVASTLYAKNLDHLLSEWGAGPSPDHAILGPMLVLLDGTTPPAPTPAPAPSAQPAAPTPLASTSTSAPPPHAVGLVAGKAAWRRWVFAAAGIVLIGIWAYLRFAMGGDRASNELQNFADELTIFILSCFVGWQVIWNVKPALHTPLMSVTNAISGIILIGGLYEGARNAPFDLRMLLGLLAIVLAMINVSGGFLVSQRMLKMFHK